LDDFHLQQFLGTPTRHGDSTSSILIWCWVRIYHVLIRWTSVVSFQMTVWCYSMCYLYQLQYSRQRGKYSCAIKVTMISSVLPQAIFFVATFSTPPRGYLDWRKLKPVNASYLCRYRWVHTITGRR